MEMGIGRRKTATSQKWAVYDLIGGRFVSGLHTEPKRTPVELDGDTIRPQLKIVHPRSTLDAIVAKYGKVTSDDAKAKWRGQTANLGVPDWHVPTTGTPSPFPYPVHFAIARKNGTERVVAIDAYRFAPTSATSAPKRSSTSRQSLSSSPA